jgi:hypothetical protein
MTSSRAASLAAASVILLGFGTPLRALWARDDGPWWLPFAVWGVMILIVASLARRSGEP